MMVVCVQCLKPVIVAVHGACVGGGGCSSSDGCLCSVSQASDSGCTRCMC